ncbi:MAG: TlyA family RNA methyltransferase [Clostridia bacterium]|nr:TlyA family RNA methyltransferase [Clostridia bacterium]
MSKKSRLDKVLVEKGLAKSRDRAKRLIMAGQVYVNNELVDKPGTNICICDMDKIVIKGNDIPFVSRGGLKLEKAINEFDIDLNGKICIDVGASTGGFTDCMLKKGASRVYSIDVGYGQFDWSLRNDPRVVCMERTNIRNVVPADIGVLCDFASIDVSFISLKLVIPVVKNLLNDQGKMVCLIKPQFEVGKEKVGKNGVVRDPVAHKQVINDIIQFSINSKLCIMDIGFSPIKGPKGNIEYLIYLSNDSANNKTEYSMIEGKIDIIVDSSHDVLN